MKIGQIQLVGVAILEHDVDCLEARFVPRLTLTEKIRDGLTFSCINATRTSFLSVVESDHLYAMAPAGGKVFASSGLVGSLPNFS